MKPKKMSTTTAPHKAGKRSFTLGKAVLMYLIATLILKIYRKRW